MKQIAISACLAGQPCRYDGKSKGVAKFMTREVVQAVVLICPEQLGGLATPRIPAEIMGGDGNDVLQGRARVMTATGVDVTQAFIRGAYATLAKLKDQDIMLVILKKNSPSCGSCDIYDGSFTRQLHRGFGVTTALLRAHGYQIVDESTELVVQEHKICV